MNKKTNCIDFPVICQECFREIVDGDIFYTHPELGYVCEHCPSFSDGPISQIPEDVDG